MCLFWYRRYIQRFPREGRYKWKGGLGIIMWILIKCDRKKEWRKVIERSPEYTFKSSMLIGIKIVSPNQILTMLQEYQGGAVTSQNSSKSSEKFTILQQLEHWYIMSYHILKFSYTLWMNNNDLGCFWYGPWNLKVYMSELMIQVRIYK